MNVFLCHSGERSLKVAEALNFWLPRVLHHARPFFSEDISKGKQWMEDLANNLKETSMGIICLTPENITSHWIHFEAGALFKGSGESHICTYLFDLEKNDVGMPLSQFQLTKAERDDTLRLIKMMNDHQKEMAIAPDVLQDTFDRFWNVLESKLDSIPKDPQKKQAAKRSTDEILEEVLTRLRNQEAQKEKTSELFEEGKLANLLNLYSTPIFNLAEGGALRKLAEGMEKEKLDKELLTRLVKQRLKDHLNKGKKED